MPCELNDSSDVRYATCADNDYCQHVGNFKVDDTVPGTIPLCVWDYSRHRAV